MIRKWLWIFATVGLMLTLLGRITPAQMADTNTGTLRVVNALVGIGPVDVFLDGERIAYGLPSGTATPYLFVAAGKHTITLRPVDADALSLPVADTLIDIPANNSKTAIAYQRVFAPPTGTPPTILQSGAIYIMDDDRSPIALGKTRLTGVHLATGTPARISIGYPSGEALLYQLGFEQSYGTVDVEAGAYPLAIIDADATGTPLLARVGDQNFYANTFYTLIVVPDVQPVGGSGSVVGALSSTPRLIALQSPIDPPQENGLRLRVVHAAHSTAVLDVYLDGRLVAGRMNFGRVTEYLGLESYSHTITLRRFGLPLDEPPIGEATFTVTPQNSSQINWTLLMVNSSAENTAALTAAAQSSASGKNGTVNAPVVVNTPGGDIMIALLPDNISQSQRGFARVRLINAADGLPPLSLLTPAFPAPEVKAGAATPVPTPTLVPGVVKLPETLTAPASFGAEASEQEIPAGLYGELDFVPTGSASRIAQVANAQVVSGVVYTFIVMGSPTGNPPLRVVTLADYGQGLPIERQYIGTITTASANIRALPNPNGTRITSLPVNTEVDVLGRTADATWIRIRFINPDTAVQQEGWVSGTANLLDIKRLGLPVQVSALPEYVGN
jgi:hypothetical protein